MPSLPAHERKPRVARTRRARAALVLCAMALAPVGVAVAAAAVASAPASAPPGWLDSAWTKPLSELLQAGGIAAAALFFGWKLASGYVATNLTVTLATRRAPSASAPGTDLVVVVVTLNKGDREAALLQEIRLGVAPLEPQPADGPYVRSLDDARIALAGAGAQVGPRMVRLSPGESASFEHLLCVPADRLLKLTVQVTCRPGWVPWFFVQPAYSRASAISLPGDAARPAVPTAAPSGGAAAGGLLATLRRGWPR